MWEIIGEFCVLTMVVAPEIHVCGKLCGMTRQKGKTSIV